VIEGNRVLKATLGNRRLRLTDNERGRLAALAHPIGRQRLKAGGCSEILCPHFKPLPRRPLRPFSRFSPRPARSQKFTVRFYKRHMLRLITWRDIGAKKGMRTCQMSLLVVHPASLYGLSRKRTKLAAA
jgi:hypothetical protein